MHLTWHPREAEAQQEQTRPTHLRFIHDRIVDIRDAISSLEAQ